MERPRHPIRTTVMLTVLLAVTASTVLAKQAGEYANLDRYKSELAADIDNLRRFLDERGLLQAAVKVERSLKAVAQASSSPVNRPARISPADHNETRNLRNTRRAWSLVMEGFTNERISALRSQGVDIFDTVLKPGSRYSEVDKAMLSELVIIGKVEKVVKTLEPKDGYRSSVIVSVMEVLSGESPGDLVVFRQVSGKMPNGRNVSVSVDIDDHSVGQEFIFYLSNVRYRFFASYPHRYMDPRDRGSPSEEALQQYYVNRHLPELLTLASGREVLLEIERVGNILEASKTVHE